MADRNDLCSWSALELAAGIRKKLISSREATEAALARIDRLNPEINAVVTVTSELARKQAKAADAAVARGDELQPLHGVPYTLKDLTATAGIRTSMGSKLFDRVPIRDDIVAERLRERGGAVLLGKTNTPDNGCKGVTDNIIFGTTRNPWDPGRTPGGSSGGAAAAVAAGMGSFAEGSDFAGSVRIPAAFCGLVGLKPSAGRIAAMDPLLWHPIRNSHGPITRTVADAAIVLQLMAGPDPRDPNSLADGPHDFLAAATGDLSIKGLRIGYSPNLHVVPVEAEVRKACAEAVEAFESLGAEVTEIDVDFSDSIAPYGLINAYLRAALIDHVDPQREGEIDPLMRLRAELAARATATQVGLAEMAQSAIYQRVRELFEQYDVIVTPTTPVPAFPLGVNYPPEIDGVAIRTPFEQLGLTSLFNLTGHPAISVPAGWTDAGLPVGLQIVGPWRDDERVLKVAAAYEQVRPWAQRWPAMVDNLS
ncbi:amidase [Bosea sp. NPDC055332]